MHNTSFRHLKGNLYSAFTLFFAVVCLHSAGFASASNDLTSKDLTSDDVNKTSHKNELKTLLAQFTNLEANFKQVITDANGEELQTAEGIIVLLKPQKLRWEVQSPEESLLIADGTTIYNIDPFLGQVTLLEQAALTSSNPLMLLTSTDSNEWDKVSVSKKQDFFVLTAKDNDAPITQVKLKFDQSKRLSHIYSTDRQLQVNTIELSQVKQDQILADNMFVYEIQNDWVIDDQRNIP